MPKRICLVPHLKMEELAQRYRQAQILIERTHVHIIKSSGCWPKDVPVRR